MRKLVVAIVSFLLALTACGEIAPKHYYVLCEGLDGNGWRLIATDSRGGYLISCTYERPDKQARYTVKCDDNGCD